MGPLNPLRVPLGPETLGERNGLMSDTKAPLSRSLQKKTVKKIPNTKNKMTLKAGYDISAHHPKAALHI